MNISIRKATDNDVNNVIELAAEMMKHSLSPYRDVSLSFLRGFRKGDLSQLPQLISKGEVCVFIAENEEGLFLGHLIVVPNSSNPLTGENQGWIIDISVKEEYQNFGVGGHLLKACEDYIKSIGHKYVILNVTSSNVNAIAFYEKHDFKEERKQMIKLLG